MSIKTCVTGYNFVLHKALHLPLGMCHFCEVLCAGPENVDDVGVAVDHDSHGQDEHDDELVPREQDPLSIAVHVAVGTRHLYDVRLAVVVHAHCRTLRTTMSQLHMGNIINKQ